MNTPPGNSEQKFTAIRGAIPAVFPQTFLLVTAQHGHSIEFVHEQLRISSSDAWLNGFDIGLPEYEGLLDGIIKLFPNEPIGFEAGWRLPPTALGSLGQLFLCSPSLGEALRQCRRFWHLYGMGLSVDVRMENGYCLIELETLAYIPNRHRKLILECALTSAFRCLSSLSAELPFEGEMHFDWSIPDYQSVLVEKFGRVRFNSESCHYRFSEKLLDDISPLSNPFGYQTALDQCLKEERFRGVASPSVAWQVEKIMSISKAIYPSLEQVAERLNLTPRTLRRRLQLENTRYASILNRVQRRDALRLLAREELEIQEVAVMLGYSEPANFTRAFQQWYGQSPSDYRKNKNINR